MKLQRAQLGLHMPILTSAGAAWIFAVSWPFRFTTHAWEGAMKSLRSPSLIAPENAILASSLALL